MSLKRVACCLALLLVAAESATLFSQPGGAKETPAPTPEPAHSMVVMHFGGEVYIFPEQVNGTFVEAERFCERKFSSPATLASVNGAKLWAYLKRKLGSVAPEMWLGGFVSRTAGGNVTLNWLNHQPVSFHRFTEAQLKDAWHRIRPDSNVPVIAHLEKDSWTLPLTSQHPLSDVKRPFVCQLRRRHHRYGQPRVSMFQIRHHLPGPNFMQLLSELFGLSESSEAAKPAEPTNKAKGDTPISIGSFTAKPVDSKH